MDTLLRLRGYFKPYQLIMVLAYIAVIGNSAFYLLVPGFIGQAVDEGVGKRDVQALIVTSVLILVFSALRGLCAFLQGYLGETAAQGGSYQLRKALYAHVQQLSFSFHDQAQTTEKKQPDPADGGCHHCAGPDGLAAGAAIASDAARAVLARSELQPW